MSEERISLKVHFGLGASSLQCSSNLDTSQDAQDAMAIFMEAHQKIIFEYLLKFGGTLHLEGPASGLKNEKWSEILSLSTKQDPTVLKTDQIWKRVHHEDMFAVSWQSSPTHFELWESLHLPS